jgi:hypothetical protein
MNVNFSENCNKNTMETAWSYAADFSIEAVLTAHRRPFSATGVMVVIFMLREIEPFQYRADFMSLQHAALTGLTESAAG